MGNSMGGGPSQPMNNMMQNSGNSDPFASIGGFGGGGAGGGGFPMQ